MWGKSSGQEIHAARTLQSLDAEGHLALPLPEYPRHAAPLLVLQLQQRALHTYI